MAKRYRKFFFVKDREHSDQDLFNERVQKTIAMIKGSKAYQKYIRTKAGKKKRKYLEWIENTAYI